MDIMVCVKNVPLTEEVDLVIDEKKKVVDQSQLPFAINDWDNYAIEEAIQLKEKLGGTVVAVTVGKEDDEDILRKCLAMGADRAVRVDLENTENLDVYAIVKILAEVSKEEDFGLVFTGVQAGDDNYGMVGGLLAEHIGLTQASMVTAIEVEDGKAKVSCELEGGLTEVSRIDLPALFTIQTGINQPRYVSIMGIKKARKKELKVVELSELGLSENDIAPQLVVEEMYHPPDTGGAEMLEGELDGIADQLIDILKKKGVIG